MSENVKPVPPGYHTVTPYLVVRDAAKSIDFYNRAFGAKEIGRMDGPDGKVAHAELQIGDSRIMLSEEMMANKSPQSLGGSAVAIFLYVDDVDAVFDQAVAAGAKSDMPPTDMFWGDRYGKLTDPFGHLWALATHIEDVAPEEMGKRAEAAMSQMTSSAAAG